jgi:large subunit ribosomal protein L6
MSRVGKLPVKITKDIKVEWNHSTLKIQGPKGALERKLYPGMELAITDQTITVQPPKSRDPLYRGLYGLTRTLIFNMVKGVTTGFEKELEIQGIGYRTQADPKKITLSVGFSHPVEYVPPAGIKIEAPKPTQIIIKGIDKELVGAVAAEIRFIRPPEPYKGKGIRYLGERVRMKVGKAGAAKKQ